MKSIWRELPDGSDWMLNNPRTWNIDGNVLHQYEAFQALLHCCANSTYDLSCICMHSRDDVLMVEETSTLAIIFFC